LGSGRTGAYPDRPAEQLYRTSDDPYELTNLAYNKETETVKANLSSELDRWMKEQGDPGAAQDTKKALQAARKGAHLYGVE